MILRLAAVAFIFLCASIAWGVLGGAIVARTNPSESRLRGRVQSVWGVPQVQKAPLAQFENRSLGPLSSEVAVALALEHRQKGLLWYSTYKVSFQGDYEFRNPDPEAHAIRLTLPLPAAQAIYDDLQFAVDGRAMEPVLGADWASVAVDMNPLQSVKLHVGYRSQGLDSWNYSFGENVNSVKNFHLRMTTNFADIDFPENTLSPTSKRAAGKGWLLDWNYQNLLSGYRIAMIMPAKLQPGRWPAKSASSRRFRCSFSFS